MRFDLVTLFPEMFEGPLSESIVKRAVERGLVDIRLHDLREWARNKHRKVDDESFGTGAGMVLKPEPLFECCDELVSRAMAESGGVKPLVLLTSPQGKLLKQDQVRAFAESRPHMIVFCGHYKGFDERFIESRIDMELSIGDYVLSGGELPAMVLVDAVTRLLPGAISSAESADTDSLEDGLLDAPVYTRPAEYRGMEVPPILLSGHHAQIEAWKLRQREERTRIKRPDLHAVWNEKNKS